MVATRRPSRPEPRNNPDTGDAAERIELLRLRASEDPVARAIALGMSQFLRRMDDVADAGVTR